MGLIERIALLATVSVLGLACAVPFFLPMSDTQVYCLAGFTTLLGVVIGLWGVDIIERRRWR